MSLRIDEYISVVQPVDKHLEKHGISSNDVEELCFNGPRFRFHEKGSVRGEDM
jgi:hypothetical protein